MNKIGEEIHNLIGPEFGIDEVVEMVLDTRRLANNKKESDELLKTFKQTERVEKTKIKMEVGQKYIIETKKGRVEKYLSYYDKQSDTYYFVNKLDKINPSKTGYMFASRGTAHHIMNVVGIVER
jgi:hypothetical protein